MGSFIISNLYSGDHVMEDEIRKYHARGRL